MDSELDLDEITTEQNNPLNGIVVKVFGQSFSFNIYILDPLECILDV